MSKKGLLASAAVAAALMASGAANATIESFDFSGSFGGGALTGDMILDVDSSGVATSGTATVTAAWVAWPGDDGLLLRGSPGAGL